MHKNDHDGDKILGSSTLPFRIRLFQPTPVAIDLLFPCPWVVCLFSSSIVAATLDENTVKTVSRTFTPRTGFKYTGASVSRYGE